MGVCINACIICIYVCIYAYACTYGSHLLQSMDQPVKVASPARGLLENKHFPVPFAPENLVPRDEFDRPVPRERAHSPHSGWIWSLFARFRPITAAAPIYIPPSAIGSIPSLSGLAVTYRWRSLPRVRRLGPVVLKVVPVTGDAFADHHGPINVRLSFPHPLMV